MYEERYSICEYVQLMWLCLYINKIENESKIYIGN